MRLERQPSPRASRGSALMVALYVIVAMGLLAAALGRFLADSEEKNTVELRGVKALMAAQSGLEIGLYRLYPNGKWSGQQCGATTLSFTDAGLTGCQAVLSCTRVPVSVAGTTLTGYRFTSEGRCGEQDLNSPNPDFAVSRTLVAEAYDGATQ